MKWLLVMDSNEKTTGISDSGLRLTALSIDQTAKILSTAGGRRITEDMVRADIEDGAPTNPDGTVNLVHYSSWLVKEISVDGD